ncbi:MAG: pantetheine-phosphate adenylyltransferase [Hyphomicrobiales bacterium]
MTRIALFAGSFDPITNGHVDVIRAGLAMCDEVVVAVGQNPTKTPLLSVEKRQELIATIAGDLGAEGRVRAIAFSNLLVDLAVEQNATILLRGLRDSADFAYEMQMAGMNMTMNPGLETVFVPARPANRHVTATLVRQIAAMGGDITPFVPEPVRQALMR